jgi:hypothetical protein
MDFLQGRTIIEHSLLMMYSARLYYRDSPVFAETRWSPAGIHRRIIGGLEEPHTFDDVRRADSSFAYFQDLNTIRTAVPRSPDRSLRRAPGAVV